LAARSAEQLGDRDAARAGYAAVLPTDNWYAALAAARTGQRFAPMLQPLPRDDAEYARVAAAPGLVRTRELILSELPSEANLEWKVAFDALTPTQQLQAIRLASGWGWHLQAIAAAARLGQFNDYELLYPRPYDAEVRRGAELTGLPPALIYAIIRQESLYRADAASSANAYGLMQLLLPTAQATARRTGLPKPTRTSLLEPSVNVPLGSSFLRYLLDRADGQWPLAIAGYNAGPAAGAALARTGTGRDGRVGREHSVQRDARVRAARALALAGVRVADGPQAARHVGVARRRARTGRVRRGIVGRRSAAVQHTVSDRVPKHPAAHR